MKYTIYEMIQIMENISVKCRWYGKTGDNDIESDQDFKAVAQAKTVKEAKAIIEELGGEMEIL